MWCSFESPNYRCKNTTNSQKNTEKYRIDLTCFQNNGTIIT